MIGRLRAGVIGINARKRLVIAQRQKGATKMTNEQTKEFVMDTWTALAKGDFDAALENLSDNVTWLVPGSLPNISGLKRGKQEVNDFMAGVLSMFPEGLQSEIRRTYCDGSTVIAEVSNRGNLRTGKFYENEYCYVFELEEGKIRRIRHCFDTQKLKEILFS